jgi:Protein of unknown function (DUF1579)
MSDETTVEVPPPAAELHALDPLVGTWQAHSKTRASVLGPGVPVRSTETFEWLDGGYFLVQTYETSFGGEPAQKGVNYWRFDTDDAHFRIVFFSNNGPYSPEGNHYEGVAENGTLTLEGPARFQYRLDDDGKVRLNDDGSVTVEWWLRDEAGSWQPWMTNRFHRGEA